MAKAKAKSKANKSEEIRNYYKANPSAKPKEVAIALKKKGISVTPQFVSTIRSVSKRKNGKVGRPGRPPGSGTTRKGAVSFDSLMKVKEIVDEIGGIEETRVALTALEKLTS